MVRGLDAVQFQTKNYNLNGCNLATFEVQFNFSRTIINLNIKTSEKLRFSGIWYYNNLLQ